MNANFLNEAVVCGWAVNKYGRYIAAKDDSGGVRIFRVSLQATLNSGILDDEIPEVNDRERIMYEAHFAWQRTMEKLKNAGNVLAACMPLGDEVTYFTGTHGVHWVPAGTKTLRAPYRETGALVTWT